jgi:hypothetical protein
MLSRVRGASPVLLEEPSVSLLLDVDGEYRDRATAGELDGRAEGQRTVVTETRGEAAKARIVRGREDECRRYYAAI